MRNIICILLLFCAVYASEQNVTEPSRYLERLVSIQRRITEAILNDVLFFEKRIKENLKIKLNDLRIDALLKVNNIINSAFEKIKLSIEEEKKKDKKIDECYDYAKHNLEMKKGDTIAELETCILNGNKTMETPLTNLVKTIQAIKMLLTDINFIISNCYSSDFIKMRRCVTRNLSTIKSSLKDIKSDIINLVNIAITTRINMINDVKNIMSKIVVYIRNFSIDIVVRVKNCAKNAPTDNLKLTNNSKLIVTY